MDRLLDLLIRGIVWFARFSKRLARIGIGQYEEWQPGQKIRILLAGYNGARNTGSDARVAAIAKQLKEVFGPQNIELTVMALDPQNLRGYFDADVALYPFGTIFPFALYRACCRSHAAILCEGSTLKSTFANGLSLFLCEAAGIMKSQGKPCVAYGSEIGQMDGFLQKTAKKLCQSTVFITRSAGSQLRLEELGLAGHLGTDTAWTYDGALPAEAIDPQIRAQGWDGQEPLIGIAPIDPFCWPVKASLSRWLKTKLTGDDSGQYDAWYYFSESKARVASFERYLDQIAEGVKVFLKKSNCFPVLLGMERLDETACRKLKEKLGIPCAVFLSGDQNASVMSGVLQRLSFLVTSRYHAAVLSMRGACPIVALSMDERLDGILQELSLSDDYLHSIHEPDLESGIAASLEKAAAEKDAIELMIREQYGNYRERQAAMGDFLKRYFYERLQKKRL